MPPERRRYYILDVLTDEIVLLEVVTVILLAVILLGVYRGAPLEHHADPLRTPLGIAAPWYFLWVQGLLKLGNPTLMGVIIPAGFFAFLLLIPYLDRNPSRRVRDRHGAIGLFLVVLLAFGGFTWLGRPGYGVQLAPAQAVVQAILPEEGAGPLRSLPWAALQPGDWDTRTVEISTAGPELRRVMAALNERLAAAGLPGARAKLVIAPWQPGLKKATLRIFWQPEGGAEQAFERSFFVHEERKRRGDRARLGTQMKRRLRGIFLDLCVHYRRGMMAGTVRTRTVIIRLGLGVAAAGLLGPLIWLAAMGEERRMTATAASLAGRAVENGAVTYATPAWGVTA